jgi:hypothetical protein
MSVAIPAQAELLRITPLGVSTSSYSGPTDPVPIGDDGFRLTYHGGGKDVLLDPVLLILGIPTGEAAPTLTPGDDDGFTSVSIQLGGTNVYGGSWNTATGLAGTFNGPGTAYDLVGLTPQGSPSQNYTNWTGATGLSSWDIYVYQLIFNPNMDAKEHDWAEFTGTLSSGTYVIGYGHDMVTRQNPGSTESTPFTFAGLVRVPEPATLSLLIPGLGLVATRRRRGPVKV